MLLFLFAAVRLISLVIIWKMWIFVFNKNGHKLSSHIVQRGHTQNIARTKSCQEIITQMFSPISNFTNFTDFLIDFPNSLANPEEAARFLFSNLALLARSKEIWRSSGLSTLKTCSPSPLPQRVPPSKQNRPPSTAPYRLQIKQNLSHREVLKALCVCVSQQKEGDKMFQPSPRRLFKLVRKHSVEDTSQ